MVYALASSNTLKLQYILNAAVRFIGGIRKCVRFSWVARYLPY